MSKERVLKTIGLPVIALLSLTIGPFAAADREQSNAVIAKRIGDLAGTEHPHLAALAETSQRSTMGADFDRALDMLLTGIEGRARDDSTTPKRRR